MRNVRQLLDVKGSTVWSIGPEASVLEAIKLMAENAPRRPEASFGNYPIIASRSFNSS